MTFGDNEFISKHTLHIQNPSTYISVGPSTLVDMLNGDMFVSIDQTIQFSISKMSNIGCIPPCWTVLVRLYLQYAYGNTEQVLHI